MHEAGVERSGIHDNLGVTFRFRSKATGRSH